ncbi:hypothetical protein BDF20DRAFT_803606, partial [Mycotypha africana]|uniref:uncharacterized protein n=1 Tax=Mycotypha africana TaxID=64632 RepID=UPI002300F39C
EAQLQQHAALLERLAQLEKVNGELQSKVTTLEEENQKLRAQLLRSSAPPSAAVTPQILQHSAPAPHTTDSPINWAQIATRAPRRPRLPTPQKVAAISRGFNLLPEGPKGFKYLYFHRSRRYNYIQIRGNLRAIGVEVGRILDIIFPARNVFGLLIHAQYHDQLLATLAKANVKPIPGGFDPTDPKFATMTAADREGAAMEINHSRCIRTLTFLHVSNRPMIPVARYFIEEGWISNDDLSDLIAELGPSRTPRHRDDPGAAFR